MAILNAGNGNDGNITISAAKNINTDILADGRSHADGVAYRINAITNNTVTTVTASPLGIAQNDEILLINLKGTSDVNYDNAGNYEIELVTGDVIDVVARNVSGETQTFGGVSPTSL
jgi:hypothetical protein